MKPKTLISALLLSATITAIGHFLGADTTVLIIFTAITVAVAIFYTTESPDEW